MNLQTLRHFGAFRGSISMFSGPDELQHLSSEIAVLRQNRRFQSRGVVFSYVGLSDSRFVSIFGRSKIGCDSEVRFRSKQGGRGVQMEFRRGPGPPALAPPRPDWTYRPEGLIKSIIDLKFWWKLARIILGAGGLLPHRRQNQ